MSNALSNTLNKLLDWISDDKKYTLDNLYVTQSHIVSNYCMDNGINLISNAAYNSPVNPNERLWALSKRAFRRQIIVTEKEKLSQIYVE